MIRSTLFLALIFAASTKTFAETRPEKDPVPDLLRQLEHKDPRERLKAVNQLAIVCRTVVPWGLRNALHDPEPLVREVAALTIFQMTGDFDECLPVLLEALRNPRRRAYVIFRLSRISTNIGESGEPLVPFILEDLQIEDRNDSRHPYDLDLLVAIGTSARTGVPLLMKMENDKELSGQNIHARYPFLRTLASIRADLPDMQKFAQPIVNALARKDVDVLKPLITARLAKNMDEIKGSMNADEYHYRDCGGTQNEVYVRFVSSDAQVILRLVRENNVLKLDRISSFRFPRYRWGPMVF